MKKSNAFHRRVPFATGIFLALVLVTSSMKAQCPPCRNDIPPITGCNWIHVSGLTFTGPNGCNCSMDYCYRLLNNYPVQVDSLGNPIINPYHPTQTIQSQVDTLITDCDSLFGAVIDSASENAFRDASYRLGLHVPCDTAHSLYYGEGYYSSCFKLVQNSPHAFVSCHDMSPAYCETRCSYCPFNGLLFNCINIQVGTPACGGGTPPSNFNLWPLNTCFEVICGTHLR